MNLEVEKYVGELRELRSEVETMKERIKNLESEINRLAFHFVTQGDGFLVKFQRSVIVGRCVC